MGRENLEDYNADFLVMLESWEAAEGFIGGELRQKLEAIGDGGLSRQMHAHPSPCSHSRCHYSKFGECCLNLCN